MKWNDKDYFEILDDKLLADQLSMKCQKVLDNDKKTLEKWRLKSREVEVRISRNTKRRNNRIKNRINPKGHLYLNDETEKKKRSDPTREVALKKLPGITNFLTSNCFINSFLQLFRHTNIEKNFSNTKNTVIYQIMDRLNNGESITQDEINDYRIDLIPKFSLSGQEDVVEFYNYILDLIYTEETKYITDYQNLDFWKAYKFTMETSFKCVNCEEISLTYTDSYVLEIPTNNYSFIENFDSIFSDNIDRCCQNCNCKQYQVSKRIVNSPEFLAIQMLKFRLNPNTLRVEKDDKLIDIPSQFYSEYLGDV